MDIASRTKKGEKEDIINYVSYYNDENIMLEQVYDTKTNKAQFVKWDKNTKTWEFINELILEGSIIRPILGDELKIGAVLLPTEPLEYESDDKLDQELYDHINKWLDIPDEDKRFACYNIRLSWVYDKFNTLNYTRAIGQTGCGKSRFLFTLGHLHYKPMIVAGALTPAVIFRIINKWKGTLMIDEGDQDKSDESNAFIKIMNCGYEKGMPVSRCDKNEPTKIDFFDVFCPKVLTTRKRFDDKATESRCMTTIMTQTSRKDIPDILTKDYWKETKELRNKLLLWKFRNYDTIDADAGMKVNLDMYEPRLRQVNRSFISLFYHNKEQLDKFFTYLDGYQNNLIEERSETFEGIIVNAIAEMITNKWENITPSDIITFMSEKGITFKYELNSRVMGKELKNLGLKTKRMWLDGRTKNCLIKDKQILETIFSRYIIDPDMINKLSLIHYVITSITSLTGTGENILDGKITSPYPLLMSRNSRNDVMEEEIIEKPRTTDEVIFLVNKLGKNTGIYISELIDDFNIPSELIKKMLQDGDILKVGEAGNEKVMLNK
jgi:hypothetical protein